MITFDDWKIQSVGYPLAMQYDHMTREMYISGDIPDGYTWDVLCRYKRELNIIHLEVVEGGISTLLTKHDLANSGTYIIQLRGTKDGTVRHSNAIQVEVPKSLSGDDQWPLVPSEFTQIEQRIQEYNNHPPYPDGENGYWMIWNVNTHRYEQSTIPIGAQLPNIDVTTAGKYLSNDGSNARWVNVLTIPEISEATVGKVLSNDGSQAQWIDNEDNVSSVNGKTGEVEVVEDKNFVFTQSTATKLWYIVHNLNKYPSVMVVDTGGNMVIGDVEYIDTNTITVSFNAAFSGYVYLN